MEVVIVAAASQVDASQLTCSLADTSRQQTQQAAKGTNRTGGEIRDGEGERETVPVAWTWFVAGFHHEHTDRAQLPAV